MYWMQFIYEILERFRLYLLSSIILNKGSAIKGGICVTSSVCTVAIESTNNLVN